MSFLIWPIGYILFPKKSINKKRKEGERGTYYETKRICRVSREGLQSIKGEEKWLIRIKILNTYS